MAVIHRFALWIARGPDGMARSQAGRGRWGDIVAWQVVLQADRSCHGVR